MKTKRNVYLSMKSLDGARAAFLGHFRWQAMLSSETVPVADAVGRVLAEPVFAQISSPTYHAAAMDGVAIHAVDSYGAAASRPVELRVRDQAVYVNTGDALPAGFDAVVMIEHVRAPNEGVVVLETAAHPWQHVRRVGEDIVATEMLFARHHRLGPVCLGALLQGGVLSVAVKRRPKVVVIATGSEIVPPTAESIAAIRPGQIIDSNSTVLARLVESAGGQAVRGTPLPDDPARIGRSLVTEADGDADLVLLIGGSSAGAGDFTRAAMAEVGEVLVHGVTMMPGKPTVLGAVRGKPVVGIPGYPVSAILAFEQFVRPALERMLCQPESKPACMQVCPSRKIASKLGMEEFLRVKVGQVGARMVATPLPRGAGSVTSITQADAVIRIGTDLPGLPAIEPVTAELLRPGRDFGRTIVVVGSHDITLDVLRDLLREQHGDRTLSSSHVGSLGGLRALRQGLCHAAGSHLLEPSDGSYNVRAIAEQLGDVPVRVVHLVMRQQGLMVRPGNPKGIGSIADLARPDLRFVNRQPGSGTRVLLDFELGKLGLVGAQVAGYDLEETTHLAVAVAVQSGAVDVGLGILAAARALGLDFVPVVEEQYDLVVAAEHLDSELGVTLLDAIRSGAFRERVAALGGYRTERTGQLLGP
jgi:putative molybdopterin biosynthesis protein